MPLLKIRKTFFTKWFELLTSNLLGKMFKHHTIMPPKYIYVLLTIFSRSVTTYIMFVLKKINRKCKEKKFKNSERK